MKNAGPESKEISDGNPAGIRRVFPLPHSPALPLHPPPQIPDHELLRCIGRGSYGEVWLARTVLGQYRAVKIVYRDAFEHDRPFEREYEGIQKFEPISRSHPSQLAILHVGRNDEAGYFYYVMDLADPVEMKKDECGMENEKAARSASSVSSFCLLPSALEDYTPKTLKHLLHERGHLPFEECLQIGISLTTALEHLHKHGLVHRDIKPSNIVFVNGVPKLADIGLVTSLDATLSFVGTAGYFPPEGPGTPAADLYSLGKVLYEASMGRDRQEFPKLPADLSECPERERLLELNAVILKACHGDVQQRYQSTGEMHAELERLQRGQSVKEHHAWQMRLRVGRRIGVAGAATLLLASGVFFLWQAAERLSGPVLSSANDIGTKNSKAAEAYKRGLDAMRRSTTEAFILARDNFLTATEADPKFMAAYARLFETYLMSEDNGGVPVMAVKTEKLNELSAKLVKLDPTNAETHAALAITLFVNDWKWSEAEREFKQALEADPNCRMALKYYGYFLTRLRRADEAKSVLQRALELDPSSPLVLKFLGHCEFIRHHYKQALNFYLQATESEPSYPSGYYWASRAYLGMTNYEQALEEFKRYWIKQGYELGIEPKFEEFRNALTKGGPRAYWTKCIELADRDLGNVELRPYMYAEWYARLGDQNRAVDWLEKALTQHDSMEHLLVDEFWDQFRKDLAFKDVLKKVGLDAWAQ